MDQFGQLKIVIRNVGKCSRRLYDRAKDHKGRKIVMTKSNMQKRLVTYQ